MSGVLQQERERGRDFAASAWAPRESGVGEAVASVAARVGPTPPSLVVVFAHHEMPAGAVLGQAAEAAPGCEVVGMTGDGLMTVDGVRRYGCLALAFGADVVARVGVGHGVAADSFAAGRAAAAEAVSGFDAREGHAVVLLFLDPT